MPPKEITNLPQTVSRALDILEAFVHFNQPLGVTELGRKLHLNKSTTYRIVQVLRRRGYVSQDRTTSKYQLGYRILQLAGNSLRQIELREVARKHLEDLARQTFQTVQLAVLDGREVVYIDQIDGKDIFRLRLQIGARAPLYCTAAGKSILAFVAEDVLKDYFSYCNFGVLTPKTILSQNRLMADLKLVRRDFYAFCDAELHKDIRAVGSPIFNMDVKVLGAVVLTIPSARFRLKDVRTYGELVRTTAINISTELGYPSFGRVSGAGHEKRSTKCGSGKLQPGCIHTAAFYS